MGSSMAAGAGLGAGLAAGGAAVMGTMAGSLGGFLAMGGGMLAGIGALTGDKDLMKFGSILTLAGGIGSLAAPDLFGKAGSGAAGASDAAAGGEAAADAASSVIDDVGQQLTPQPSASLGQIDNLPTLGQTAIPNMAPATNNAMNAAANAGGSASAPPSFWDRAVGGQQRIPVGAANAAPEAAGWVDAMDTAVQKAYDPLQAGASSMTGSEVNTLLQVAADKAKAAAGGLNGFIKGNKEVVSMVGNALSSMYGPQAESLDWQKSLYERRRRNLNDPVRLGIPGGG